MKTITKPKQRAKTPERLPSTHPGRILRKEVLEERGITVDRAIRLSKALGTSVDLWLNLQRAYDLEEAQRTHGPQYNRISLLAAA